MSTERFVHVVGEHITRRGLLVRAGAATLGLIAGAVGWRETPASANQVACCDLAYNRYCSSCFDCATWLWTCCAGGHVYYCCECYAPNCKCNSLGCSIAIGTGCLCNANGVAIPCP